MGVPALPAYTSSQYVGFLHDEAGAAVPFSALTSAWLTLTDKATGTAINGRTHQNVLNVNNVQWDWNGAAQPVPVTAIGYVTWSIQPADNATVIPLLAMETHIALFEVGWGVSGGLKRKISIAVENL